MAALPALGCLIGQIAPYPKALGIAAVARGFLRLGLPNIT